MYPHFIDQAEASLIQQDFEMMLNSAEAVNVSGFVQHKSGVTIDPAFGTIDYLAVTERCVTGNAIQEIVSPYSQDLLKFGIIESGDAIFYFSVDFDLQLEDNDSVYFLTPDGLKWVPVPFHMQEFYKYIRARLGSGQVGQAVPARLKKSR